MYSAHGSQRSHYRGQSSVKQRRYMTITWLAAFV
jgi:hypothetical protein